MPNYRVVRSSELSGFLDDRFVIVDPQTGAVLDDAQGHGYRSRKNAHRAWAYKDPVTAMEQAEARRQYRASHGVRRRGK